MQRTSNATMRKPMMGGRTGLGLTMSVTAASALMLAGCGNPDDGEGSDEIENLSFQITSSLGTEHSLSIAGDRFATLLEEKSEGQISTTFTDTGALIPPDDELTALSAGTVEVGSIVGSYHVGSTDFLASAMTLPYAGDMDTLQEITRETWDDAQADVEDRSIKLLFSAPVRTEFFFAEEVSCSDPDWSGLDIRSHGGHAEEVVQIFNGNSQFMPSSEIASAASTGVIDAFATSLHSWREGELDDYAPYVCDSGGQYAGPMFYGINMDVWDGLNEETQNLILEASSEAEDYVYQRAQELDDEILSDVENEDHITVQTQTAEDQEAIRERLQPVYDGFESNLGERATRYLDVVAQVTGDEIPGGED